ncbi:hypothetical protein [Nesterenkonia haasae]|uniref:hypothetical protein n=1 Tax=Nesterenkonia haasae TaxID=2587813 RepID=UPI00139179B8|nr:hypothetical protein [Nesterenkonia haasae]NDK31181.1 hypothetical protein [Nesterenkonia haasae]
MRDPVVVVSKRTGQTLEVPRARLDKNPHLFRLPARAAKSEPKAKKAAEQPEKTENTTDKGGR